MKGLKNIFLLLAVGVATFNAQALDVYSYGLVKGQSFTQTGPSAVNGGNFTFIALVITTGANTVSAATFTKNGAPTSLSAESDGFFLENTFADQGLLDAAFPATSTYTMSITAANDGTKSGLGLSFGPSNDSYPVTPQLTSGNYTAAQTINSASNFTFTWNALGGTVNDYLQFQIENGQGNSVFSTPQPGMPGALNGTETGYTIPPGTLTAGASFTVRLLFAKSISTNVTGYAGVTGFAAYMRQTSIPIATAASTDTFPPFLNQSSPYNQSTQVAVNSVIAFTFSEPMGPGISIAWSGANAANFSYAWSTDKRKLFCVYNTSLPQNTTIGWTLNPSGQGQNFKDLSGNALPANTNGSFTTANQAASSDTDVRNYIVAKGMGFVQTGVTPVAGGEFTFGAFTDLNVHNSVTNGTVRSAIGPTYELGADSNDGDGDSLNFESHFSSTTDLDTAFPNGNYTITFKTAHDGTKTSIMNLSGDFNFTTPAIANFSAAQAINPTNDYVLSWTPFSGGTANDFIQVEINNNADNSLFHTPSFGESGRLTGLSNSVVIPGMVLFPGRTYQGKLIFAKTSAQDTTSYVGALGVATYFKQTSFTVTTIGTRVPITLNLLSINSGSASVRVSGERDTQYDVQYSTDLTNWFQLFTLSTFGPTNQFGGTFDFQDGISGVPRRFYRAKEYSNGPN